MQTLISQNNHLREQLTAENRAYYEKLLLYLRVKGNDEVKTEELLLEILEDLLEAQANGQSAQQYFGAQPKVAANELLEQLNTDKDLNLKEKLSLSVFIFCLVTLFELLHTEFDLVGYLIEAIGMVCLINFILFLIGRDAFERVPWRSYLGTGIAVMVYMALVLGSDSIISKGLVFSLTSETLWVIGLIFVVYIGLTLKWPQYFSNNFFYIFILVLAGFLAHLPLTASFFQMFWGHLCLLIVILLIWALRLLFLKK